MPRSGANDLAQLLGDNVGKAGGSDRRSEGTEQDVGKSSSRVAGEAGREQLHNAVDLSSVDGDIKRPPSQGAVRSLRWRSLFLMCAN